MYAQSTSYVVSACFHSNFFRTNTRALLFSWRWRRHAKAEQTSNYVIIPPRSKTLEKNSRTRTAWLPRGEAIFISPLNYAHIISGTYRSSMPAVLDVYSLVEASRVHLSYMCRVEEVARSQKVSSRSLLRFQEVGVAPNEQTELAHRHHQSACFISWSGVNNERPIRNKRVAQCALRSNALSSTLCFS